MTWRRPDPLSGFCTVELRIPWELAEHIARHGDEFVKAIQHATGWHETYEKEREEARQRSEATRREKIAHYLKLSKAVYRRTNRFRSTSPGKRRAAIEHLAIELDERVELLDLIDKTYGPNLRRRIRARRNREILRLYLAGFTNNGICREIKRYGYAVIGAPSIYQIIRRSLAEHWQHDRPLHVVVSDPGRDGNAP